MRETENTAYARKREFLLCTDICGSALDTLRSRQEQAYCPALVEVFELEEHAQEARRAWMSVALESRLRGGNRFRLLSQACVRIAQQGAAVPGLDGILHWVESGSELTHGALAARVKRGAGPALARALAWSREVNRRLTAMPKENKVIVEKVNVATCHTKPRRQGEAGGIVKRETPIRSCKVALFCEKCNKGVRVGYKMDGDKKVRICRKCGAEI